MFGIDMPVMVISVLDHGVYDYLITTAIIVAVGFAADRLVRFFIARWERHVTRGVEKKGGEAAPVRTRFTVIGRTATVLVYIIAIGAIMFQFKDARAAGSGLLASAGIIAIVVGLASQSTLSNFIAGVFLSFSQPIRLNDSIIFESNWGWVEEISLTHTTIRTWDNRRIIVPNQTMASTTVENWTIKDSWLMGIVMMYVDYSCPVDTVRQWAREIVDASPYSSEERVALVQVVDFTEKCMVLRILGRGADPGNTWQLRCELREKLIERFRDADLPLPQIRLAEIEWQRDGMVQAGRS